MYSCTEDEADTRPVKGPGHNTNHRLYGLLETRLVFPLLPAASGWRASWYLPLQRLYRQAPRAGAIEERMR